MPSTEIIGIFISPVSISCTVLFSHAHSRHVPLLRCVLGSNLLLLGGANVRNVYKVVPHSQDYHHLSITILAWFHHNIFHVLAGTLSQPCHFTPSRLPQRILCLRTGILSRLSPYVHSSQLQQAHRRLPTSHLSRLGYIYYPHFRYLDPAGV